ncbi:hypothetical protein PO124_08225 [Bacillus licheniformis]|nr:hypothetical protein [Bacillus licheniformis]
MAAEAPAASLQYKSVTVKPGQTVFQSSGTAPFRLTNSRRFEELNPNVEAGRIQAGVTYKFPVYPD